MYLYLDLIWLLNFCIDVLLLWMTALFRHLHVKKWRLFMASAVGSTYVLFLFLPPLQSLYTFFFKFLLSLLIVLIAFGFINLQSFLKSFSMFYFVSFITGGGMLAVHYTLQYDHDVLHGMITTYSSGYGDPISWLFVCIGFPVMYWFSRRRWQQIEKTELKAQVLASVMIDLQGTIIRCTGLLDTGNQLYDPLTKAPVMIIEIEALRPHLPEAVLERISQQSLEGITSIYDLEKEDDWLHRFRIIPYRGVGQGMELMVALKPERVAIIYEQNHFSTTKILIGLNKDRLSHEGLYQAILHPDMLHSSNQREVI